MFLFKSNKLTLGECGLRISGMLASFGVLSLFFELHALQDVTIFSQDFAPPFDFGSTWSIVNSSNLKKLPQY